MREVRLIDQDEQPIDADIMIDGGYGGSLRWVPPNKRTRIAIAHKVVTVRIERIEIGNLDQWWINDIQVHGQSLMPRLRVVAPSIVIDDDGLSAHAFVEAFNHPNRDPWTTLQTKMLLLLDVTYSGPKPAGQPFGCVIRCKAYR